MSDQPAGDIGAAKKDAPPIEQKKTVTVEDDFDDVPDPDEDDLDDLDGKSWPDRQICARSEKSNNWTCRHARRVLIGKA